MDCIPAEKGYCLSCCPVSGPKSISEHGSVVEQLAYIQRAGGSIPSVPIR
nr:MAG TPA: hypothetical protein [Caudoviricetes sp.]